MENKDPVTIEAIIAYLEQAVANREVLDAATWLKYSQMMNVLLFKQHDRAFELDQLVAKERLKFLEEGKWKGQVKVPLSVAEANLRVEVMDEFREAKTIKAHILRVEEMIKISKRQAGLKDSEYRNQ